jgi:hypothetical protein
MDYRPQGAPRRQASQLPPVDRRRRRGRRPGAHWPPQLPRGQRRTRARGRALPRCEPVRTHHLRQRQLRVVPAPLAAPRGGEERKRRDGLSRVRPGLRVRDARRPDRQAHVLRPAGPLGGERRAHSPGHGPHGRKGRDAHGRPRLRRDARIELHDGLGRLHPDGRPHAGAPSSASFPSTSARPKAPPPSPPSAAATAWWSSSAASPRASPSRRRKTRSSSRPTTRPTSASATRPAARRGNPTSTSPRRRPGRLRLPPACRGTPHHLPPNIAPSPRVPRDPPSPPAKHRAFPTPHHLPPKSAFPRVPRDPPSPPAKERLPPACRGTPPSPPAKERLPPALRAGPPITSRQRLRLRSPLPPWEGLCPSPRLRPHHWSDLPPSASRA